MTRRVEIPIIFRLQSYLSSLWHNFCSHIHARGFVLGLFFSFFPFLDDPTLTSPTSSLCNYCPPPSLGHFKFFWKGHICAPPSAIFLRHQHYQLYFFAPTSCILHQHALLLFPPPPHLMMVQVFLLLQLLCKIHEFCFLNFSISPQKHDKVQVDKFGYIFSDLATSSAHPPTPPPPLLLSPQAAPVAPRLPDTRLLALALLRLALLRSSPSSPATPPPHLLFLLLPLLLFFLPGRWE